MLSVHQVGTRKLSKSWATCSKHLADDTTTVAQHGMQLATTDRPHPGPKLYNRPILPNPFHDIEVCQGVRANGVRTRSCQIDAGGVKGRACVLVRTTTELFLAGLDYGSSKLK